MQTPITMLLYSYISSWTLNDKSESTLSLSGSSAELLLLRGFCTCSIQFVFLYLKIVMVLIMDCSGVRRNRSYLFNSLLSLTTVLKLILVSL